MFRFIKIVFVLSILKSSIFTVAAQKTNLDSSKANTPHVEWIKNWSDVESKKSGKFNSFFNAMILGIKQPKLIHPMSVYAFNNKDFLILDQSSKNLFHVQNDIGKLPQAFRNCIADFSSLIGLCCVPEKGFLFTDSQSNKIYELSLSGKKATVFNDSLILDQPTGIAYSSVKNEIWVIETKQHRISVLNLKGQLIKRIGTRGSGKGEFNFPTHLWIDNKGFAYVTDAMNYRIEIFNPEGEVVSAFGEIGDASGYFARPKGVAVDSYGNIYVVDGLSNVVQVFNDKGVFLYHFGQQGHENGQFWMPSGIFIDNQNFIYIADTYNSRIQIFQLKYLN